jgi:hypothetical protein
MSRSYASSPPCAYIGVLWDSFIQIASQWILTDVWYRLYVADGSVSLEQSVVDRLGRLYSWRGWLDSRLAVVVESPCSYQESNTSCQVCTQLLYSVNCVIELRRLLSAAEEVLVLTFWNGEITVNDHLALGSLRVGMKPCVTQQHRSVTFCVRCNGIRVDILLQAMVKNNKHLQN